LTCDRQIVTRSVTLFGYLRSVPLTFRFPGFYLKRTTPLLPGIAFTFVLKGCAGPLFSPAQNFSSLCQITLFFRSIYSAKSLLCQKNSISSSASCCLASSLACNASSTLAPFKIALNMARSDSTVYDDLIFSCRPTQARGL